VSSNPVEGRTKFCQLKDLILTLFGLIFNIYIYIIYQYDSVDCLLVDELPRQDTQNLSMSERAELPRQDPQNLSMSERDELPRRDTQNLSMSEGDELVHLSQT
jgi:hypothetical protein